MKKRIRKVLKSIFSWIFKEELEDLNSKLSKVSNLSGRLSNYQDAFDSILNNIDVSVDAHEYNHKYSRSWAVVSLQGNKSDYIKFIDLGDKDIMEINGFLRRYERSASNVKIDASPRATSFLKFKH